MKQPDLSGGQSDGLFDGVWVFTLFLAAANHNGGMMRFSIPVLTPLRMMAIATLCLPPMSAAANNLVAPGSEPPSAAQQSRLSQEPFYAGIILRARDLKSRTQAYIEDSTQMTGEGFAAYQTDVRALAADNMKAHDDLKIRGTDNDLKCILKGVSLDLDIKMDALVAARSREERHSALSEMDLLLSDNIDVIVTPATADSGMDCLIEFGP